MADFLIGDRCGNRSSFVSGITIRIGARGQGRGQGRGREGDMTSHGPANSMEKEIFPLRRGGGRWGRRRGGGGGGGGGGGREVKGLNFGWVKPLGDPF